MKIQKTSNMKLQKAHICVLGPSGTGKTFLASTIKGKPLILDADKGTLTLKKFSLDKVTVTTWDEVVEFMKFITSKQFEKMGYDWVVIDSVSAVADILTAHLEEKGVTGFDFWGQYGKLMGGLMHTLKNSTTFNSLSLFELVEKENNGILEKRFGLQGSLASKVPYFYDFVFASKRISGKKDSADTYALQTCHKNGYNMLKARLDEP